MLTVHTPDQAAHEWIASALTEQKPREPAEAIATIARELHRMATEADIPVEELVEWIHTAEAMKNCDHADDYVIELLSDWHHLCRARRPADAR